jgi:hypothetical protein
VLKRNEIEGRGNEASALVAQLSKVAAQETYALNPRGNQKVIARALAGVQRRAENELTQRLIKN